MAASKFSTATSLTTGLKHTTPFDGICAKISAFYFDLDNTLIPTRAGDSKAIRKLADVLETQYSFTKDDANLATQNFLKSFRRCPDNSQTSLDSWRTHLWRESLQQKHKHLAEQIYPQWLKLRYRYLAIPPDYVQLLQRMRRAGYLLALITNGPSNAQREKINKLHVRGHFDCVLVSSDLPWEKPHPEIFYAACNFLGVKPHECAMIGDKLETDIKGGHLAQLGLTFWLPLSTSSAASQCLDDVEYKPHVKLNSLLDLYKYFPRLNAVAAAATPSTTNRRSSHSQSSSGSGSISGSGIGSGAGSNSDHDRGAGVRQQPYGEDSYQRQSAYRRGGSLPAMDCSNSEAENSCDSFI
ncbi:PREDICTED: N-acylneuraminate-9-phosphatase [Drosophila arizonae]|uniref:N-acylneuraminate-9-phosphatase n=1 Tax=Drosophila arizonae TaxID=7263 RepID=A0ABM1PSG9_DROAR|nr:PREDICTED: N-acylneuraminate-9-phosphatase [Drosophila arizonae]